MLNVLSAGLPESAKSILEEGLNLAYGGSVSFTYLEPEKVKLRVRLANGSSSVVLVLLTEEFEKLCSGVAEETIKSDIYHKYSSDSDLVEYINTKFGLSIELPEKEEEKESSFEVEKEVCLISDGNTSIEKETLVNQEEEIKNLRDVLKTRDSVISNLEVQIKELTFTDDSELPDLGKYELMYKDAIKEIEELKSSKISLESKNKSLDITLDELKEKNKGLVGDLVEYETTKIDFVNLKKEYTSLEESKEDLLSKVNQFDALSDEYTYLKDEKSKLEASLEASLKTQDVLVLEKGALTSRLEDLAILEEELTSLKGININLESDIDTLRKDLDASVTTISAKDLEINKQGVDLSSLKEALGSKELDVAELIETVTSLDKRIEVKDMEIENLNNDLEKRISEIAILQTNISKLEEVNKALDTTIVQLNSKLLNKRQETKNEDVLLKSKKVLLGLEDSTMQALEKIDLVGGKRVYSNISFAFSGSTASRKGTYKAISKTFESSKNTLIVDLVSESSIDYVYGCSSESSCLEWLISGGDVRNYITSSSRSNLSALVLGNQFINDSYFLRIDWDSRLRELGSLGCEVVVYCGDLSSFISRVLYNAFVGLGEYIVYVQGSIVDSRALITNIKGLLNKSSDVKIHYFEFNPKAKYFYDIIKNSGYVVDILTM